MAFPIKVVNSFAGQNWLITPAAPALHQTPLTAPVLDPTPLTAAGSALHQTPPQNIHDQQWLLTLSGVAMVDLKGNSQAHWLHETLVLQPTVIDPMHYAIGIHSIPKPPGTEGNQYSLAFQVDQLAPFASIGAIFNQGQSVNSGFAVDVWRPNHYGTGTNALTHLSVGNLWTGLQVDVAVRDTDAWLYRVGYSISLLGKIVFIAHPETLFRSNFDPTPINDPPAHVQDVGTANIKPRGSVIVIAPPVLPSGKWVQIGRRNHQDDVVEFQGVLSHPPGDGVYIFAATLFLTPASEVASISFETAAGQEFMHLDFMRENTVRIDDGIEFGSFPRDQPFIVQVTLKINGSAPAATTARIALGGADTSGDQEYTIAPGFNQFLSRQFGAIRLWQGWPFVGVFDATNIIVKRA